jgi:GGDEF domain-containing protein
MEAATTARSTGSAEQRKARYRLVVLSLLALVGLPVFHLDLGLVGVLYGILLVGYSLWAMRLTVVFHDDDSLGLLLTVLDVALTMPLLLWGAPRWFLVLLVLAWAVDVVVSVTIRRSARRSRLLAASHSLTDPATGFATRSRFAGSLADVLEAAADNGSSVCLITLTIQRYNENVSYYGAEAAEKSLVAVGRRVLRDLGDPVEVFRLSNDLVAFLLPDCNQVDAAEMALSASRAANSHLVAGRRVDSTVGYALAPRDGRTPADLVRAARESSFVARPLRSAGGGTMAGAGRSQVAVS